MGVERGVYLEFLAEPALQLEPIIELEGLSGPDVGQTTEAFMRARSAMRRDAVIGKAQRGSFIRQVDGQEPRAPVTAFEGQGGRGDALGGAGGAGPDGHRPVFLEEKSLGAELVHVRQEFRLGLVIMAMPDDAAS